MIFVSHFSFGSGGGVPAIGCGLGLVTVPRFVVFADRRGSEDVNVTAVAATTAFAAETQTKKKCLFKEIFLKHTMKVKV